MKTVRQLVTRKSSGLCAGLQIFTAVVLVELADLLVVAFIIEELGHTDHVNQFHPVQGAILVGQIAAFSIVAWLLGSPVFVPIVTRLRQFLAAPQLSFGLFLGALFLIVVAPEQIGLPRLPGSASAGGGAFTTASQAQVRGAARAAKRGAGVLRAVVLRVGGTAPGRLLPPPAPSTVGVVIGLAVGPSSWGRCWPRAWRGWTGPRASAGG